MEWSSVLLCKILIMTSFLLFFSITTITSMTVNYVKPFANKTTSPCPSEQRPCLTLGEYTSDSDVYFISNTIFYFYPGIHRLDDTLILENLYNLSFLGWPNGNQIVKVAVHSSSSISWKKSWNIEISSIRFALHDNFIFIMRFEHSQLVQLSNISIYGNGYSGCSSVMTQESTIFINNSVFTEINGFLGVAVMMVASNITFRGNNKFVDNTAASGGSIYLSDSILALSGASLFLNNTSLMYSEEVVNKTMLLCSYQVERKTIGGGGAIFCITSYMKIYGHSNFIANVANFAGGALLMDTSNLFIQGITLFSGNMAGDSGGALSLTNTSSNINGNLSLDRNEAKTGGAIVVTIGNLSIQGYVLFNGNTAILEGGALYLNYVDLKIIGTVYFNENYISAISTSASNITFIGTIYFYSNTGFNGGVIYSYDSNIVISGTVHFEKNQAIRGGAMLLEGTSKLILKPKLSVSFISNHANYSGGTLYFRDSQCSLGSTVPIECFIIIDGPLVSINYISLHFENNSAGLTGSILYGGQFNKCRLSFRNSTGKSDLCVCNAHYYSDNALKTLINLSTIVEHENSTLDISSPAKEIRFCEGNERSMWISDNKYISAYPGGNFNIQLIALGQTDYPVPARIFWERYYYNYNNRSRDNEYRLSPPSQILNTSCTSISFRLHSVDFAYITFKLYPENPCQSLIEGLILSIEVLPCPLGFALSENDSRCVCDKKLKMFARSCYIDSNTESIERMKTTFWISKQNNKTLILHEYRCPLDYCTNGILTVTLEDPLVQCDFNRTGMLCGQCKKTFSLAIGSLHCIPCDNNHTALIMLFALAGVALIVIIIFLQLTVSIGTLNGLFFYANIIQTNHQAFFPRDTINIFTVFISWLNLDVGIETCFYDGMDIYAYSWLQFLFPFYVWFLVGCIIFACRYYQSIAKRLGQNPVAVLATLLLMSYSKILNAIIVPLSWTYLTYYTASNETKSVVWLYDASIQFFGEPKHTALGLFAILCLTVFVVPYISLLFFGHWLLGCSNWQILSWLNKIKPFMDTYHAPYKKNTRYWTGLLLLSRLGLFLGFANVSESVNITAVTSVAVALLAIRFRVYEHFYNDVLESSFILNLGIFSVATFYLKKKSEDTNSQLILSSISVGIAFITFIGILLFHISLVLKSSSIWKKHWFPFIQKSLLLNKILRITPVTKDKTTTMDKEAAELHALPTSTEIDVDLRESLLEITESQTAT